jgi:hypothetical protein
VPKTAIIVTNAVVKFGPTASAVAYECQVTSAAINATPNLITVPATGCAPETQQPAATSWALALTYLQDWGNAASLSQYLFDNDTMEAEFEIHIASDPVPMATGVVRVVAGSYGGDFSQPLTSTVTMPCQEKPVIGTGVVLAAAERETADV